MQRLLSLKLASSNFCKRLTDNTNNSSFLLSQPLKTFTTIAKSTHHNYKQQNRIFGFSQLNPTYHFYPCRSHHIFSGKVHGFPSNSLLSKHFVSNLSNTHLKLSSRRLKDYKFGIFNARFCRGYNGLNSNSGFYWRNRRSWFHRLTANDMVMGLILANVAVFIAWQVANQKFMVNNFMISLDNVRSGRLHTMITSAFSHIDMGHIVSNMIGLYFFGTSIGTKFGPQYLLYLYLAGATGGSVFYLVHHAYMSLSTKEKGTFARDPSRTPGLGASGAVTAIMLLEIFLNPRATILLNFFIPVPAILLGIFVIGKDLLRTIEGDDKISGSAHLGGAAVAAIAYSRIRRGRL
ncbi:hypothetical protein JCGZ_11744 [Jatropha curcas]|uniref:Peptidase S54 rhomboid domain-containing protein n=1 Tax=Jatropha curcas TaxID=180498 RepID=A0A067K8N1_JATCU|nr:RHOMBOID-like protein 12, mitochondrial [Jatropha curcas]KDP31368.1 hypothetical protein JCGZ_11744 [Jatropha curcas]